MKVLLNTEILQTMDLFQKITGVRALDCINNDDAIYFVVEAGKYGLAVGKGGEKIRKVENVFNKTVKLFEFSEDLEGFIKSIIPEAGDIDIDNGKIVIKVKMSDRAKVIGKGGRNIKIITEFLKRLFDIESVKLK